MTQDSTLDTLYNEKFKPNYELGNLDRCVEMLYEHEGLQEKLGDEEKDDILVYTVRQSHKLSGEEYGRVK